MFLLPHKCWWEGKARSRSREGVVPRPDFTPDGAVAREYQRAFLCVHALKPMPMHSFMWGQPTRQCWQTLSTGLETIWITKKKKEWQRSKWGSGSFFVISLFVLFLWGGGLSCAGKQFKIIEEDKDTSPNDYPTLHSHSSPPLRASFFLTKQKNNCWIKHCVVQGGEQELWDCRRFIRVTRLTPILHHFYGTIRE